MLDRSALERSSAASFGLQAPALQPQPLAGPVVSLSATKSGSLQAQDRKSQLEAVCFAAPAYSDSTQSNSVRGFGTPVQRLVRSFSCVTRHMLGCGTAMSSESVAWGCHNSSQHPACSSAQVPTSGMGLSACTHASLDQWTCPVGLLSPRKVTLHTMHTRRLLLPLVTSSQLHC